MQTETQREASRPERSPEVFLLSAYTWRDDPEIKRGWEVSSDPPGVFHGQISSSGCAKRI